MKALILDDFGGIEHLKMIDVSAPQLGPDEVQIRIAYTAVNPVDWKIRLGYLKDRLPHDFPIVLGWDAAGTIAAVGPDVKGFKVGDDVFAYCRQPKIKWGTYAEAVNVPFTALAYKPRHLSFAQAAAIPLAGLTAWQALFDAAHLKEGETVLIHAGAGGVGSLAIQFAKQKGARIITTASDANHSYVKELGADIAIDYHQGNLVDQVKAVAPEGVDVVFDTVGKDTLKNSYALVKKGGRLVSIVEPPDQAIGKKLGIQLHYVFVSPNGKELQQIADLIETGKVKPIQIEEMPLEKAGEAQEKNRQGHTKGKIVLKVH